LNKSRRSFLKRLLFVSAGLFALPSSALGYATAIEPRLIHTERIKLSFERLPKAYRGMRILQFSDTHLGFHFHRRHLEQLAEMIREEKPDMVCFTGDLVDRSELPDSRDIIEVLRTIEAPLGCFSVLGNHDYHQNTNEIQSIFEQSGFRCLRNQAVTLWKDGDPFTIAGVEDMAKGKPNIRTALQGLDHSGFVLLLSHCPDYAHHVINHPIDLQLSGHSHGGQVRLPFVGGVAYPPFGRLYPNGLYSLGDGKMKLYTNRGIGVSQLPVRFMCRPELTVFTLDSL
jgi:uncharacterized protein